MLQPAWSEEVVDDMDDEFDRMARAAVSRAKVRAHAVNNWSSHPACGLWALMRTGGAAAQTAISSQSTGVWQRRPASARPATAGYALRLSSSRSSSRGLSSPDCSHTPLTPRPSRPDPAGAPLRPPRAPCRRASATGRRRRRRRWRRRPRRGRGSSAWLASTSTLTPLRPRKSRPHAFSPSPPTSGRVRVLPPRSPLFSQPPPDPSRRAIALTGNVCCVQWETCANGWTISDTASTSSR